VTAVEADALLNELGRRFQIAPGLHNEEFDRAERTFDVRFPPDLRLLLSRGLPLGGHFIDWRGSEDLIIRRLHWPEEGILFDVQQGLWPRALGAKPADPSRLELEASAAIRAAPTLVPLYGHRYLPCEPLEEGNPVFSVWQSDVIRYGDDLSSYLQREFRLGRPGESGPTSSRRIRFWDDLVDEV
jgi:hypothetical protein